MSGYDPALSSRQYRESLARMLAGKYDGSDPVFERTKTEAERGVERFRNAVIAQGGDPDEAVRNLSRPSPTPPLDRELTEADSAALAVQSAGMSAHSNLPTHLLPAHLRGIINKL